MTIKDLEKNLNYKFNDEKLLDVALRHRSVGGVSNERLEFLGDSVVNFAVASELFKRYPKFQEGALSRLRANLIRKETLAKLAIKMDVGNYLYLGAGEKKTGGHRRDTILSDAMEAVIGAIYLDSNFDTCRDRIVDWYGDMLVGLSAEGQKDAKTELQEYMQSIKMSLPIYEVIELKGKAHEQKFYVECQVPEMDIVTKGEGVSIRKAEQDAAEKFLSKLDLK